MDKNYPIKSYKDLLVWQKAHQLIGKIFCLVKKARKDVISWEIIKQLVRSATSIAANIVEGYYSHKGKTFISHLEIAKGSAGETDNWIFELYSNGYITKEEYEDASKDCFEIIKMLSGLINKIRERDK
jgi:four helix bundle protein